MAAHRSNCSEETDLPAVVLPEPALLLSCDLVGVPSRLFGYSLFCAIRGDQPRRGEFDLIKKHGLSTEEGALLFDAAKPLAAMEDPVDVSCR